MPSKSWPSVAAFERSNQARKMPAVAAVNGTGEGQGQGEEEQRLRRERRVKMRQLQQDLDPRLDYEVRSSIYQSKVAGRGWVSSSVSYCDRCL